jgi:V8-like Glu-specific endopeptidase
VLESGDPGRSPASEGTGLAPAAAGDVTGANWTAAGAILARSGLILFTLDGTDYSCTGSTIQDAADPAYSLVITAAHCAYDETTDVFATNWVYIPAWDLTPSASGCPSTTYGCWDARALVVHAGWANEEGLTVGAVQHDFAVAVVGPGGKTGTQLDALGAYPVRIGGVDAGDRLHAFGYPATPPYDGTQLVYCLGSAGVDPVAGTWGLTCDMAGGASGGPWLTARPTRPTDPARSPR